MSRRTWVVILLAAALYLVGNGRVQLWDRDEPRYAQTSRQMLQSGDWVVPTYLDEPRLKKPPLVYWCQAACMDLLGYAGSTAAGRPVGPGLDAFAARLPSVVAMVLTLALLGSTLARIADERRAFYAVLVMATSGLTVMAAKMCLTDAVLLLFVTAAQLMVYAMWLGQRDWWTLTVFAAATGLALLTKGPVTLGVNATTLAVLGAMRLWDRWRAKREPGEVSKPRGFEVVTADPSADPAPVNRLHALGYAAPIADRRSPIANSHPLRTALKILYVLAIVLAIGVPWVIALQMRFGGALTEVVYKEVFLRISTPLEQHKGPPGYYLAFFFATFFPWCLLLPTAVGWAWRHRREPLVRFALAAIIGPWVMFEAIQTKLPHYVLPCFPFLAILVGEVLARAERRRGRGAEDPRLAAELTGRGFRVAVVAWAVILVGLSLVPWLVALPEFGIRRLWVGRFVELPAYGFGPLPYAAMVIVSLAAVVMAGIVVRLAFKRDVAGLAHGLGATMFVLMALLFTLYLPRARFLHLSEDVGTYLQAHGVTGPGAVQMIDYKEDTLPFYQGGTIRPQRLNAFLATADPEQWPAVLVITREVWEQTPPDRRALLEVRATFRGWAYAAQGRVVEVLVVARRGAPGQ